ncbi:VOC family protein [Streptomyces sp. NPDC046805]|uniref:VOC family protein n=1 Tax=Streptomyces sp. NPDC046805 TaxID=3155134 RepID=UPI0034093529
MAFHHVGLATKDMEGTKAFYEDVLGFTTVRNDAFGFTEGGQMRHLFLETGKGELLSFLEPTEVPQIPDWDTGINEGLGVPNAFYHLAFDAETLENLEKIREDLVAKGVKVTQVVDHDWCKSIYFFDPVNGLPLEYCTYARAFNEDDRTLQYRFTAPFKLMEVSAEGQAAAEESRFATLAAKSED